MATEAIQVGVPTSLVQNQVYALPASRCLLYCDQAATILSSNTQAFTSSTAMTLVEGKFEVAAAFIKMTSAGPQIVTVKKV
jgi:hypothetical protein